ncbi:sensor histidine kinase [Clostridium estertheticum]|uniref:cache domain-containing sensor histidine kinase n=1 Tax=Clostridium estertheticum TaxID=238834 RepID=UPI001C0E6E70|nr:sensor histidine kinase [Clostridium estertheticum]MBU3201930.1 sensor histidine kinase [Clostridium estertheticum]WAG67827.1 sensor histidine kinase [Clostridium estertheticum]
MKLLHVLFEKIKCYCTSLYSNRSIRKKLFLSSVLLMVTVVITFSVLSYRVVTNIFVKRQVDYYESSLKLSTEYFNNNFIDIDDGIKKLHNSTVINKYLSNHVDNTDFAKINSSLSGINDELNTVFLSQNYIDKIILLGSNDMSYIFGMDKQGSYLGDDFSFKNFSGNNHPLSDDKNEGIPFYYKYNKKNLNSSITEDNISNTIKNNITYVRKLRNANNNVIGMIIITFKPAVITDLFSDFGEGSNLYLLDPDSTEILSDNVEDVDIKYHTFKQTQDIFYTFEKKSGSQSLLTYYTLALSNLQIVIKTPISQVYPDFSRIRTYLILYGISCIITVIILSYFLSRKLSIPLINLANTITKDMPSNPCDLKSEHLFPLQNYGLRTKLIAYFSMTVILPIILFSSLLIYNYYILYYDKVTGLTVNTVAKVRKYIDYNFNNYNYITSQFVYDDTFQHSWPESETDRVSKSGSSTIRNMFSDIKRSRSEFFSVNLYNVKGDNIYSDINLDTFPVSDVMKNTIGELKFLGVQKNYYKKSVLVFARKIRGLKYINRPTIGYAVFFVEQSYLDSIYQILGSDIAKDIILMDSSSNIITQNNMGPIASLLHSDSYISKTARGLEYFTLTYASKSYVIIQNISDSFMYKVACVIPLNEITSMILPLLWYVLYILLAYSVVIVLITSFFSSSIVKPLKKLLSLMKKGDLEELMSYKKKDEIAILSQQFNKLILENYQSKLRESQQLYLEKEIALTSLQQQINPHFLYNTLEIIKWMAYKKGAEDICNMVTALGNFFRGSVSTGNELITFAEEIEHLKSYIYIHEIRCGGRSEILLDIEEEMKVCKTVKLILQPLVENSIKHGIDSIRHKGIITIHGYIMDERVNIEISDNGVGMSKEKLKSLMANLEHDTFDSKKNGIGLSNVYRRIMLCFKDQAVFSIDSRENIGTCIKISFPAVK